MESPSTSPIWWQDAKKHLRSVDPIISKIIDSAEEPPLQGLGDVVITMCNAVVGQQISAIAADAIWFRLIEFLGGKFDSSKILDSDEESLRNVGLSRMKIRTLKGICDSAELLRRIKWDSKSQNEIQSIMTEIWGVGPWTAEMAMIFSLHLPDILPLGDIGVIRSIEALEGKEGMKDSEILERAEIWKPYRTCAVWYLWRQHDDEPVLY
ncbi:MAG: DNA-3-methyladenine glycosylase [Euryarchaeota archaeon]|nr:DNA-3-methyladenine glycosylase [Euryarchaeota archaeon]|tara:strand:- start:697 stop:1323 length:627 start_codon:yes stop_codon:yes gene_type:complete